MSTYDDWKTTDAHPATGTTCTRCGQVIQSVLPAFPPVATVDGWRHDRCPEVPPEPVRDSIDALRYAVQGVPPGPVPVEADVELCPGCTCHREEPGECPHHGKTPPAAPASEPAVDVGRIAAKLAVSSFKREAAAQYRIADLEADLTAARAALIREGMERAAARTEVDQLRGKLAESEKLSDSWRRAAVRAAARVRSMREAAAKVLRDAIANLSGPDYLPARIFTALGAIERIPLDTGTATDTGWEAAPAPNRDDEWVAWCREHPNVDALMPAALVVRQADAIKAAPHVCKCSNGPCPKCGGTGPEGEWFEGSEVECADCGAPLIVATAEPCHGSSTFEAIDEEPDEEDDESGEDAPGAVTPAKGGTP